MDKKNQHPIDLSQRLFIELGTPLLIESEKSKKALSCKLIGMKVGGYLIVNISGDKSDAETLPKEEKVQVRYVNQDDIFNFSSQILITMDQPDFLIFLDYPEKVESCNIRTHRRVDCFISIHLKSADLSNPAVITNISTKGCLCNMDLFQPWKNINDQQIELIFPYGDRETLTISGEVKSTQIQETQIKLGIQFNGLDAYSQSVLGTLVPAMGF